MSFHYIMITEEVLELIKKHHETRSIELASKICDKLYKQTKQHLEEEK